MKTILIFCPTLLVSLTMYAQTNGSLTNHVPIGNRGISFTISDETKSQSESVWFFDKEILSDASLRWILHNPTTNHANVHFQGINHTFSLKLFDERGHEVPLTTDGTNMILGPIVNTNHIIAGNVRFIGLSPGDIEVMDFPSVDKLFEIPHPGGYVLEARYWYRDLVVRPSKWQLSEPIRLKVIKLPKGVTH